MSGASSVTKAKISKLLVVDASVMRAAGGFEATDPVPARARQALMAMLDICHRVCLSSDISDEWKRHQSKFAGRWLTQMYARRKVVACKPPSCEHIVEDIRSFHLTTESDIAAVEKDIHLIAAALTTSHRAILSQDNRVAAALRKVCGDTATMTSKSIAAVLWINPIADHDSLRAWLSETGPVQSHWPLGIARAPGPAARRPSKRSAPRSQK